MDSATGSSAEPAGTPAGTAQPGRLHRLRRGAPPGPAAAPAPRSLQVQLRRQLLALLATLWLAAALAAGSGLWRHNGEMLDSALRESAERLLMLPPAALAEPDTAERLALVGPHDEVLVYQVLDAAGQVLLRSHRAPPAALDARAPDGLRDTATHRVITLSAVDGQRRAQVAETLAHRRAGLWAAVAWLLGALLALLVAAGLATGWLLRRGFATLEPLSAELARRPPHDLRPLAVHQAPAELQPWLASVNGLLARVASLVESERSFAANTAHELRTPLAAARAQAQRLARQASAEGGRAQAQALVRQLDRLTSLATRLLQLARIESGVALLREPVDLVQLAVLVLDDYAEATRAGSLQLVVQGNTAPVQGDIDALGIALRNLIDNALKHGGGLVQVRVLGQTIAVRDDGPGVPAERLPGLVRRFDRGARLDAVQGSGLGLAMVAQIARQSGARLVLRSPAGGDSQAAPGTGAEPSATSATSSTPDMPDRPETGAAGGFEARLEFDPPDR